jgi:integrase
VAIFKRGKIWWYKFQFGGQEFRGSTKTTNKTVAGQIEDKRKRDAHEGWSGIVSEKRSKSTLKDVLEEYVSDYKVRHKTGTWVCVYGARHLTEHLGDQFAISVDLEAVKKYQTLRLQEGASKATIDTEVSLLCRAMSDRGEVLRAKLRRRKMFIMNTDPELIGRAFTVLEQDRLLKAAAEAQSPLINFALQLVLNGALRDKEARMLKWSQIDFVKNTLRVEKSKNRSSRRDVPLNGILHPAFERHRTWYIKTFGELRPAWYVFPFGRRGRLDPSKPVTGFDGPWKTVRKVAGVEGRWHDTRHTVISQLGEQGASAETIMAIAGHVSPQMLKRYCHIGMEAKREAMEAMIEWRDRKRQLEIAEAQRLVDQVEASTASTTIN